MEESVRERLKQGTPTNNRPFALNHRPSVRIERLTEREASAPRLPEKRIGAASENADLARIAGEGMEMGEPTDHRPRAQMGTAILVSEFLFAFRHK
jgi:hypothetical protein